VGATAAIAMFLLAEPKKRGKGRPRKPKLLLVEQTVARAVEFADRAYILRSGRVAHSGTREEILRMEDFETAYLGV